MAIWNLSVGGEPVFLGSPVSPALDISWSFAVGLSWPLLFAQGVGGQGGTGSYGEVRAGRPGLKVRQGPVAREQTWGCSGMFELHSVRSGEVRYQMICQPV